jgi:hypothetical protein
VTNSSSESENEESKQNTLKINIILYNLLTKAGDCKPGQAKIKEHEDRTTFNSFIRTAQYGLFNPNRPRRTGTFLKIPLLFISNNFQGSMIEIMNQESAN